MKSCERNFMGLSKNPFLNQDKNRYSTEESERKRLHQNYFDTASINFYSIKLIKDRTNNYASFTTCLLSNQHSQWLFQQTLQCLKECSSTCSIHHAVIAT
jgi:hypothetical protein